MDIMRGHVLRANDDRATDVMDADVLVLATDGINAVVTSGGLVHTRKVKVEDLEAPVVDPSPLMRRLAYGIAEAPKRFEEKDQEVQRCADLALDREIKLRNIRKWMIATHEDGTLPREDLDGFLDEFGMESYTRPFAGTFTVTFAGQVADAWHLEDATDKLFRRLEDALSGTTDDPDLVGTSITTNRYTWDIQEDRS